VAWSLFYARKYDDALEQIKKTLQMDANLPVAHWDLADIYVQKKMYPEAVAEWQKALTLSGDPTLAATLGEVYRLSGFQGFLRTWTDHASKDQLASSVRPYQLARLFALKGDKDEAVNWLRKALAARTGAIVFLKYDPVFDPLRSDPAFQALIKKMNFPE
jgi:tetratricopeptide (TPR) repeat protein